MKILMTTKRGEIGEFNSKEECLKAMRENGWKQRRIVYSTADLNYRGKSVYDTIVEERLSIMEKLYYVRTSGYDMIICDDSETRWVLTDDKWPEMHDMKPDKALAMVEDWSSWEQFEQSIDELLGDDGEILAVQEV